MSKLSTILLRKNFHLPLCLSCSYLPGIFGFTNNKDEFIIVYDPLGTINKSLELWRLLLWNIEPDASGPCAVTYLSSYLLNINSIHHTSLLFNLC